LHTACAAAWRTASSLREFESVSLTRAQELVSVYLRFSLCLLRVYSGSSKGLVRVEYRLCGGLTHNLFPPGVRERLPH